MPGFYQDMPSWGDIKKNPIKAGEYFPGYQVLKAAGVTDALGNMMEAPQAAKPKISTARGDEERGLGLQARGEQGQLGEFWRNQMEGKGPSVAELQLRRGTQQAQAAAASQAASGRGSNTALANRVAAQTAGSVGQQANAQAAELRAGEQLAAAQQYQELLQQKRMQDLQARGLSVEEAKAQLMAEAGISEANLQAETAQRGSAMGMLGSGIAMIGLGSDARTKEDVFTVSDVMAKEQLGAPPPTASFPEAPGFSGYVRPKNFGDLSGQSVPGPLRLTPMRTTTLQRDVPAPVAGPWGQDGTRESHLAPELRTDAYLANSPSYEKTMKEIRMQKDLRDEGEEKPKDKDDKEGTNGWAIGGGIAQIAMGLGMLSDEGTKKEVRDLTDENAALRRTMSKAGTTVLRHLPLPGSQPFVPRDEAEAAEYGRRWTERNQREMNRDLRDVIEFRKRKVDADAALRRAEAGRRTTTTVYDAQLEPPPGHPDDVLLGHVSDVMAKDLLGLEELPGRIAAGRTDYPALRQPGSVGRLPDLTEEDLELLARGPTAGAASGHPLSRDFSAIPAHSWKYKEPWAEEANVTRGLPPGDEYGRRRQVGPMAQDLERVPATRHAVKEGPDGVKRVDAGRLTMTNTAAIGDLSRRLDELEAQKDQEILKLRKKTAGRR